MDVAQWLELPVVVRAVVGSNPIVHPSADKSKTMEFKDAVYKLVQSIPEGRVMTYGQIAGLLGRPRAAQYVGWTLHWSDQTKVPYQRVVNRHGEMAAGYTSGGRLAHKADLEAEGIEVSEQMTLDLDKYLWHPSPEQIPVVDKRDVSASLPFSTRHR